VKARAAALAVAMVAGAVAGAADGAEGAADRAEDVGRWTQRKAIGLPALTGPRFVEAVLDADVYRDAAASLADLRMRENDRDVAYVVRRHETAGSRVDRDLSLLDRVQTRAGEVRFVLDLGPAAGVHNRVRLRMSDEAKNFRVPVRIETSADRRGWDTARAAGFIYVVEGESRAADTSIGYPDSTARYLRVTITPADGRPVPVTGAAIGLETPARREEDTTTARLVERAEEPRTRTTRLLLDLGSRRPVDRLDLDVADRTFSRVVRIEASDDAQRWRWAGSGAINALDAGGVKERQTAVAFGESTARYLRLTIDNLDDRPLDVTAARAMTVRRGVVFEARPGQTYRLEYGNPRAPAPRYDLARALPHLRTDTLPPATLGPAAPLEEPPTPWLRAQPVLLWTAMAAAILVLGAILVKVVGQTRPADS
jgi:hypothetical protein